MVIVGALTSIIYGLFVRTSDALTEVDALAQTLDRARFGLIHVRNDLQGAGSQATPNGATDPWVQPKNDTSHVKALRVYDGWDKGGPGDEASQQLNPGSRFSGFIVIGAYDFPQSFLVNKFSGSQTTATMEIEGNERGLGRLFRVDPFDTRVQSGLEIDPDKHSFLTKNIERRALRIMDSEGFFQFARITKLEGRELTVEGVQFRGADQFSGLDSALEDDVSVDVALLDAFWYEVRPDPADERNHQLVRHRVDAGALLGDGPITAASLTPEHTLIIADNVVDFRVWFDCANSTGQIEQRQRQLGWDIDQPGHTCLGGTQDHPERARAAHIRLSIRTPRENPNRPHLELTGAERGFETEGGGLVTYSINPATRGSASVVTVQTSVELTGLAMRGVL